jgi:beta-lactamase regulating signal transducer with metallopeptidase domain
MNDMLSILVPSLGWALLDFVWQGLLVGWGAALLLALLRKSTAQVRYAVACAALLLCAALPLAGTVQRVLDARANPASTLPQALADAASVAHTMTVVALPADRLADLQAQLQQRLPLVILFWACGAGVLALRMLLGLLWVRRRSRPGQFRVDARWQAALDRLAQSMGIARRVTLGLVDDLTSPVTAGWWRPVVLVPASLVSGMPAELLEALLAHELAHVRRLDYLVNLIQSAIEVLLFYHPTVWWLSNRIRVEREQIADDLAASTLGEPRRLALALSELDLFQLTTPQLAHAAHGGKLMSRIKRLVCPEAEPLNWKLALPILGLAACAAFYTHTATAQAVPAPVAPAQATPAQAAPAPAAPAQPVVRSFGHTHQSREDAYALVRDGEHGTNMSGDSSDWGEIDTIKRNLHGEFLWFRDGGKSWVVQDPAILARANAAWEPVDRLGKQMDEYGKQMDVHGKNMEALGHQMEAAAATVQPDEKAMQEFQRKMDEMGRQMEKLGEQFQFDKTDGAERERISRQMNELGSRMREAGERFRHEQQSQARQQAHAAMDDTGRQMREAGVPMHELGKQMGTLGKQMEKESLAANKTVRELIREAREKGLARPAPVERNG